MAVSRNIEEQKKKLRAAVQNAQQAAEKKSSYTFTPKVGSANNSFNDIPKQEAPRQTVSVEVSKPATKKTFVPSTVMGRVSGQQTRENTFAPKKINLPNPSMREKDLDRLFGEDTKPQLQNPRVTEADLAAHLDKQPKMNSRFYDDFNKRRNTGRNTGANSLKAGSSLKRSAYFNYEYPSDDYKDFFFAGIKDNTLRSDLLKFITRYDRNTSVQDRNTLWQGGAELADRYRKATGKNFDIAEIGNEYTRAQAAAEQNRRDNYFYRKLEDYYSRVENADFDTVAGKFADPTYYGTNKDHELAMRKASSMEQRIYHYLRKTEGDAAAEDFLDRLELLTNQRVMQEVSEPVTELGENHRVLGGVGNAVVGLGKGLAYVDNAGQALGQALSNNDTYRPYNPYTPMTAAVHFSNALKSGVTKDLTGAEKVAADLLLNVGENTVRLALGPAGLYVMGAGAAGETAVSQGLKGETNAGRAFATGTAYGAVEIATEKLPLDNLLKILNSPPTNLKQAIVTLLKNAAVEGGEEAISNIADNIADKIINGDKSEFAQYRNALIQNGIGEDKATLAAFLKFYVSDTVTDAAQGAAAGAFMSGGSMAISSGAQYYDNVTGIGQEIKNAGAEQSVVDTGMQSDEQTGARKYAERLQNKQGKGKELTDWNVGRQYLQNVKAIQSEEQFINSLSGIVQTQTHSELYDDKGNELNGRYIGGENSRVDISVSGDTSVPATAKHEFTHAFKQIAPTAYSAYENYVISAAMETNAEAVNNRLQFLKENYGYSDEVAREEIAAELTGTFNTKAAEKIASGNVTLADKITSAIRTAKAQIRTAYSNGNYENSKGVQLTFEQLNNAEKLWNKALGEAAENGGQVQTDSVVRNSIIQKPNGDYKIIADRDIFNGVAEADKISTLKKFLNENIRGNSYTALSDGAPLNVAQKNKTLQKLYRPGIAMYGDKYNARLETASHYDEVLEASTYDRTEAPKNNKHGQSPSDKRIVEIEIPEFDNSGKLTGSSVWEAEISVINNEDLAYDISKLKKITKNTHSDLSNLLKTNPDIDRVSLPSIISQQSNFVKQNPYRRSVKEGNEYTPASERKTLGQALNDNRADIINSEPVANYNRIDKSLSAKQIKSNILESYKKRYGYDGQYFHIPTDNGEVLLHGGLIENAADKYLHSDGEISDYEAQLIAGIYAISDVIQSGKELGKFVSDKGYASRYIGGLITIDGAKGDIGIAIRNTAENKSEVRTVRLLDGQGANISDITKSGRFTPNADITAPHTAEDAHNAQAPIENYLDAENNADWDSLMNGQEARRQEALQSRERQAEFLDGAKRGVQQRFDEIAQEDEYTDWDNLLQSEEAQRQEDRQRAERERQERQRTAEFMRDDTLINAYNSESVSRTDKKRFGKEDIVPALKKYGIGFMAREVDKLYPIKSYERFAENQIHGKEKVRFRGKNSPYVMSSNSIDAESRAKYILTEELTDFDANPIGESLADIVGDLSYEDYTDFNTYLKLRHGVEWITGDQNTDKPVFDSKILNDPAAMKAGIRQLEEKHPEFTDLAQRIYKYQADLMKAWLVDTGVITQEQYDTLRKKYPAYVPFFRQDDTPSPRFRPKKGIANQGNPIMEAEGGRQRIYDPIENIMINTSRFVNAAAKNSAMQAVVNIYDTVPGMEQYMAEAVKDPETGKFKLKESGATAAENSTEEYAEPEEYITDMVQHAIKLTDGDIVTVLQNGQKRYFKVFDADFLKAIDNLHPIQVGAVMRAVASATRVFSALATSNNPVFTLASNPIKDTQNAFAQTVQKNPFAVVTAILDAQVEQVKNSDMGKRIGQKLNPDYDGTDAYKKYMAMGGEYASAFSAGRKAMNEALGDIKPEQQGSGAKAKRAVRFIPNAYGKVADAIETGPRLGEFKYSNGKAGNDVHQAHFDSKNVTLNFGRSGYVGEKINKFVPFYNPSVQGISMMIQNFKDRPLQTSLRVGTMIAISALMLALNKRNKESEEEYKSASSYLKNNYYLLHMGGGHFFKVPKSQEYGLLPSLVERAVEKYAFDNPDAFYDYTDYISTALLPSIFKAEFPFVDTGSIIGLGTYTSLLENKDFKGSPIVPDYLQDEVPAEQYDDRTSYIARWIGKALGWSPKKVDYVIKSNTGFLGKINESVFHEGEKDYSLGVGTKFSADSYFSTDKPNMFYENKDTADRQAKSYPTADSTYLSKRFAQAQSVLGIINQIYKEDPNSEKGRQTRKAYVNYAGWNKDNPTGLTDEVFDEVKGLYNEDSSILKLPEVQREIKADGASYTFDSAQSVMNYQKDLNTAIDRAYRKQIADVGYSTMTDSEKAEILSKAKQSAIKSVKQFYIENEGKARMSFGTEDSAVKKPSAAAVREQQEKNEYRETVQSSYMQSVADNYAKVNPGKAGEYDVDSMQIKDIKKDILKNKGYELTGDTKTKVIAAANERYYADIEKFYSGEANIEDIIGYATNGKPKYSTDNNGKRVYLTGGRYNSDGSPRFDETVEGKIMFRIQDAAQESALEEYADEIAGDTSSVADATPSPQGEGSGEPMRVSSTRFRSTRRSSGGRRSSGNSGGSRSGGTGRGVSVQAANVSESAARRRALEQLTGRSGGNPTIAKAIRGLKLEPVKALKL